MPGAGFAALGGRGRGSSQPSLRAASRTAARAMIGRGA
jgi:hypothetical protein